MEEPVFPDPWSVRRATLIDVPAVARLLGAPAPAEWRAEAGLSDQALTSATRLVLTHVALDLGEFWVAVGPEETVRAAVVLLPPGERGGQIMDVALRLELGLLPRALPEPVALAEVPTAHWLLLPAAGPDDEQMLRALLDAALPAIDADGHAVLSLQPGPPPRVLFEAGFRSLSTTSQVTGSASLRPAARRPVGV
jgi:hypothetical protein